ncbi:SUKH-4 family immunity protein [Streptomyces sp. NPDC006367]|uniref:SUKH-4 family immunity protein n=1 Tax=unclassified Streptomyces TaxID=2593676 RepID=UPI0033BF0EC0
MSITLTEDQLDPYVTHEPSRSWLTGPGLPDTSGLLTCAALRRDGLVRLADTLGDFEGRLAKELRDRLVLGELLTHDGTAADLILLDGTTGEVSTTCALPDRPDLMDSEPLAPSLRTLTEFATAVDELADLRGRFADYAHRYGPRAAAEASRRLLALFEEDPEGGEPAPLWKMAALIRPLALVAAPGSRSGLALDLPPRLLDDEFGAGDVVRFEEVDFPAALTHEPTRRFLREVGLPEDGLWFSLDAEVPLPTLEEYWADDPRADPLPPGSDRLIRLGYLLEDASLVVDGATGAVLCWSEAEETLRPLNADLSTLAFTLWLVHRERALDAEHDLSYAYEQLADTMTRTLAAVDPAACAPSATGTHPSHDGWPDDGRRYWPTVFDDAAGGGLCA